jgi:hypothetical protein
MLSAFVNEHQNDWDEYLPYISMAYRAAEHETKGNTPIKSFAIVFASMLGIAKHSVHLV